MFSQIIVNHITVSYPKNTLPYQVSKLCIVAQKCLIIT